MTGPEYPRTSGEERGKSAIPPTSADRAQMNGLARLLRRIAVTVVGTVILAVGLVLLPAPGPGILVILLAVAVFAVEYEWARRRLVTARALAQSAAERTATSRIATATAVLFGLAAIGLGGVLIFTDVLPLSGAGTGAGVALGGLTVVVTTAYGIREVRRAQRSAAAHSEQQDDSHG
jgi:uncharacterized protein (TIGR02611 family)